VGCVPLAVVFAKATAETCEMGRGKESGGPGWPELCRVSRTIPSIER
jgi:hypothetical protein